MAEVKHTPGPWNQWVGHTDVYAGNLSSNTRSSIRGMPKEPLIQVASCDTMGEISREEERANAALIAAAPDLLAALKRLAKHVGANSCSTEWGSDWDFAAAAVAKAEGGAA